MQSKKRDQAGGMSKDDEKVYLNTSKPSFKPHSDWVTPMLTDLYQITMVYSYFMLGKHRENAVFDVFFRKAPFKGTFAVFCGLEDVLRFVKNFLFTEEHIEWLKLQKPTWDDTFWDYLRNLDCSALRIDALEEGTVCFPRVPMLRLEGPLGLLQLLETTILNSVNYATLMATNAARHRLVVGPKPILLEFGLRRAQGPDGGCSASRYSYIGGYNGTSNVAASFKFGVPMKGTHAHSYVTSFSGWGDFPMDRKMLAVNPGAKRRGNEIDLVGRVRHWRKELDPTKATHEGELVAFTSYAVDFAVGFLALIDTYNTMGSGVVNFAIVAMALLEAGYRPIGIRIDSGDLGQQSYQIKEYFERLAKKYKQEAFRSFAIMASNDIDEKALAELSKTEVSGYGVGTNLVTCKGNPALGGVYKLVELKGEARIKLSAERFKTTIPGKKQCYRIFDDEGVMQCDVLSLAEEKESPEEGVAFKAAKWMGGGRVDLRPGSVKPLLQPFWAQGRVVAKLPKIDQLRERVMKNIWEIPEAMTKRDSPTPYEVLLHEKLHAVTMGMIEKASRLKRSPQTGPTTDDFLEIDLLDLEREKSRGFPDRVPHSVSQRLEGESPLTPAPKKLIATAV